MLNTPYLSVLMISTSDQQLSDNSGTWHAIDSISTAKHVSCSVMWGFYLNRGIAHRKNLFIFFAIVLKYNVC